MTCRHRSQRPDSPGPSGPASPTGLTRGNPATRGDPISDDHLEHEIDLDEIDALREPDFRATIRDGRLWLHEWNPFLLAGGPTRDLFRARRDAGVAIADIRRWRNADGSGELSVEFDDRTLQFSYVQPDRSNEAIQLAPEPSWSRVAYAGG